MWKHLKHPNILPLLGVTTTPFQLVSNWVSGGDLPEYIEKHPDGDRRRLVGVLYCVNPALTHVLSCPISPRASAISTRLM